MEKDKRLYDRDKDDAAFHLREATEFFLVSHRENAKGGEWTLHVGSTNPRTAASDFRELLAHVSYYVTYFAVSAIPGVENEE